MHRGSWAWCGNMDLEVDTSKLEKEDPYENWGNHLIQGAPWITETSSILKHLCFFPLLSKLLSPWSSSPCCQSWSWSSFTCTRTKAAMSPTNLQKASPVPSSRWRVTQPRAGRRRNISSNDSRPQWVSPGSSANTILFIRWKFYLKVVSSFDWHGESELLLGHRPKCQNYWCQGPGTWRKLLMSLDLCDTATVWDWLTSEAVSGSIWVRAQSSSLSSQVKGKVRVT